MFFNRDHCRIERLSLGLLVLLSAIPQAYAVPLPKPRPPEAQQPIQQERAADDKDQSSSQESPPPKPEPSACRLALTEDIALAPSIPPIHGPGSCGGDDLVRLEAVVVSPDYRVTLKPPAILRCTMATAIANWVRQDAAPLANSLGSSLNELDNFDSYECRGRNRVKGALLSEHGKANALDVRSLNLANGTKLSLTDRRLSREVREKILGSVCERFSTVLGPASDWYHEDHIHLDLAERRNNYKICQWDVEDPMPQVAPLMPDERPADAPPREVAQDGSEEVKPQQAPGGSSIEGAAPTEPSAIKQLVAPSTNRRAGESKGRK
ncbi:MAG: extensin family protein [Xanthobacteraceae bacterium]|nr:extensin family protein [Xanthobacteraceae bacterium]